MSISQDVQLCPGQVYNLGFDYKFANNGPDCYSYIWIIYADESAPQAISIVGSAWSSADTWESEVGSFTATSAVATISAETLCANYENGVLSFDQISIVPVV